VNILIATLDKFHGISLLRIQNKVSFA